MNTSSQSKLPPGPKGLPFFGSALAFQSDPLHFVRRLQREYGSIATVYFGKLPFVFCFRPEHARYFLTEQQKNFKKAKSRPHLRRRRTRDGAEHLKLDVLPALQESCCTP